MPMTTTVAPADRRIGGVDDLHLAAHDAVRQTSQPAGKGV
jgi:hypothetical protein